MSVGERVPLPVALKVADELVERLGPACERIEVAGSIRRGSPTIGDIELVAIPRMRFETQASVLFAEPIEVSMLHEMVGILRQEGVLLAESEGPRYIKSHHVATGIQVDLFVVRPPATWGCIYLIRTGPATFSQAFVSEAKRRHLHHVDGALHRGGLGCGAIPCEVIPTPEETDVFAALNLPFVPPEERR